MGEGVKSHRVSWCGGGGELSSTGSLLAKWYPAPMFLDFLNSTDIKRLLTIYCMQHAENKLFKSQKVSLDIFFSFSIPHSWLCITMLERSGIP